MPWLTLPAGLELANSAGQAGGQMISPALWHALSKVPLLHPSPEGVTAGAVALTTAAAPLVLLPAVRLFQATGTLPRWAKAPVGLAVVLAGVGHCIGSYKVQLMTGVSYHDLMQYPGVSPLIVAFGSVVAGLIASLPPRRKSVRRDKNGRWQANFMKLAEAKRLLSDSAGLVLGEAYLPETEQEAGKAVLLRRRPKGHLLTVAGSGAGKGLSTIVPNALAWNGPLVLHDPAGETLAIVRQHRESLGRKVRVISTGADTDGVNVLEFLDPATKHFWQDILSVVAWLEPSTEKKADESSFSGLAKNLCAALIAFVLTSDLVNDGERHLLTVRRLGASPRLKDLLTTMLRDKEAAHGAMANAAGLVLGVMGSDETFAGVMMHFSDLTAAVEGSDDILCGCVAPEKKFKLVDLLDGETDLFICLPSDILSSIPQIPRILLGSLATSFLRRTSRVDHDTLLLIDEMPLLGKMAVLRTIRDFGRKFGVYLWAIAQNLGQLEQAYGKEDLQSWLGTPEIVQIYGVGDIESAKMLSERCGDFTAEQTSESKSRGRTEGRSGSSSSNSGQNVQGTKAALITPDELMTMALDAAGIPDEQIVFIRGRKPLRCGMAKYYRRPEMAELTQDNPFYKGAGSAGENRKSALDASYLALMAVIAGFYALHPVPLSPGDKITVVREAEVFSPVTAKSLGQDVRVGARGVVLGYPRQDGYVVVGIRYGQSITPVLVSAAALDKAE